ncbi:MAG: hypothetical protein ACOCJN_08770 [Spirochaetaceae bacterium JB067]
MKMRKRGKVILIISLIAMLSIPTIFAADADEQIETATVVSNENALSAGPLGRRGSADQLMKRAAVASNEKAPSQRPDGRRGSAVQNEELRERGGFAGECETGSQNPMHRHNGQRGPQMGERRQNIDDENLSVRRGRQ